MSSVPHTLHGGGSFATKRGAHSPGVVVSSLFLMLWVFAFATRSIPLSAAALVLAGCLIAGHLGVLGTSTAPERRAFGLLIIPLTVLLPIATLRGETAMAHYAVVLLSV